MITPTSYAADKHRSYQTSLRRKVGVYEMIFPMGKLKSNEEVVAHSQPVRPNFLKLISMTPRLKFCPFRKLLTALRDQRPSTDHD